MSIQRLFYWGAYADKYGGTVQVSEGGSSLTSHSSLSPSLSLQETTLYGCTVRINEPVGVIGVACPDEYPLLAFISLCAPAVVRGNTIIIIPSETAPLSATDLYQVTKC